MENPNKISVTEDDDEDLEALRLAALQSLKRKNAHTNANGLVTQNNNEGNAYNTQHSENAGWYNSNRGGRHFPNKRGRFFSPRGAKNGQFHPIQRPHPTQRPRNPNLIAITPIGSEENNDSEPSQSSQLSLPQDRFYSSEKCEEQSNDSSSKFKRYDNSDESDEESEEEKVSEESDDETAKLTRSDSLEALMQELDDEIQGKSKPKEEKPVKQKTRVKKKKISENTVSSTESESKPEPESSTKEIKETTQTEVKVPEVNVKDEPPVSANIDESIPRKRQRNSPPPQFFERRNKRGFNHNNSFRRGYSNAPQRFQPPVHFNQNVPPPLPHMNSFLPPNIPPNHMGYVPPPFFDRPISPLSINTETLQVQTMAPLSPRSAAFVLQNRAIIEKRKRSPRRSYSRSPSPRLRSLSPRSPRRSLTPRRRSRTPPKRRSLSPRRRSMSPRKNVVRKVNPPAVSSSSPKNNRSRIKDRLGVKTKPEEKEPSPKKEVPQDVTSKTEEKPLDPVLEARKRKFENKEITAKEGVIRLKPKEDDNESQEQPESITETQEYAEENIEELDEDALLDDDELELETRVDIFSDEDSGSENEGRFKTKMESSSNKPPTLSFSKLVNGINQRILDDKPLISNDSRKRDTRPRGNRLRGSDVRPRGSRGALSDESRGNRSRGPRSRGAEDSRAVSRLNRSEVVEDIKDRVSEVRCRSPDIEKPEQLKNDGVKSGIVIKKERSRIMLKSERHPDSPKKFERKIEIKIKNPAKYEKKLSDKSVEKSGRLKFSKDEMNEVEIVSRRVEVENKRRLIEEEEKDEVGDEDLETEVVVDNGSEDEENAVSNEGDLRAQLSKKRAEKLHKKLPVESVSSRLLQNALQDVVFKKVKKSKSKHKELSTSDGKLPIHLRLGFASHSQELFDAKPKSKSRKRKNREKKEQVVGIKSGTYILHGGIFHVYFDGRGLCQRSGRRTRL